MTVELIIGAVLIVAAVLLFLHIIKSTAVTALAVCALIAGLFLIFGGIPGLPGVSNFLSSKFTIISGDATAGAAFEIVDVNQDAETLFVTVTNTGILPLEDFDIFLDDGEASWTSLPELPLEPKKSTVFSIECKPDSAEAVRLVASGVERTKEL